MTERKYSENEVRRIFALATREKPAEPPPSTPTEGLTIAELQSIAREVGVEPSAVAAAVASLDSALPQSARNSLGMPVEVGRVVALTRAPSDEEWERLVAELRMTFKARGRVSLEGGARTWTNGNLFAIVEPAASGYRLRLGTRKGNARTLNILGGASLATGIIAFGSAAIGGGAYQTMVAPMALGVAGFGALLANWLRLPQWAKDREDQMTRIAATMTSIMASNKSEES